MAGGIFLTVTCGDGGWLCHGDDVAAKGFGERVQELFLRCCGLARTIGEG
jgi:hypothetical protein